MNNHQRERIPKIAGFENEAGKMFIELVPQTGAVFRGVIINGPSNKDQQWRPNRGI